MFKPGLLPDQQIRIRDFRSGADVYQAVHIGIASNLSRDSFIYAMMRFVGGRVHPEQFTEIMVQILGERRLM